MMYITLLIAAVWLAIGVIAVALNHAGHVREVRQQRAQQQADRGGFVSSHNGAMQHD